MQAKYLIMKKLYYFVVALFMCLCAQSQVVVIPDANFKTKLLQADTNNTIAKNLSGDFFKIDANNDSEIQVSEALQVSYLDVSSSFIASLTGILSFSNLEYLNTAGTANMINTLDLSGMSNLKTLICAFNGIYNLNVSGLANLELLSCGFNNFTVLDVSTLTNLRELYCSSAGLLISLDVSGLANLESLGCSNNFALQELRVSQNQITGLTLENVPNLITLEVTDNPLTVLDVSNLTSLQNLDCSGNQLETLNVNSLSNLQTLDCSNNQLTSLYLKNGVSENSLNMNGNPGLVYVCADAPQIVAVQALVVSYGYLTCVVDTSCSGGSPDFVSIPDGNFKAKLLAADATNLIAKDLSGNYFKIDANNDSEIQFTEAEQVSYLYLKQSGIASLEGIAGFTNLLELRCSENLLTEIDLTGLINLLELHCSDNQITALDLDAVSGLQLLHCDNNMLTTLNANNLHQLTELHCSSNPLQSLFIKNGMAEDLELNFNVSLEYICADDIQLSDIQNIINLNSYTNCNLNTYCSFTPGGTFYTVTGDNRIDANVNGCDPTDAVFLNSKFTVTDGTTTDTVIANADGSGIYGFSVPEGTYTIFPVLENPSYFSVTPASVTVTFPTQNSPVIQNFCYVPIGVHYDLEISMIPMNAAVPGFSAAYSIIYKNKGNQTQSGTVTIFFDETQLISSMPFDFTDLKPFETRTILLSTGVNSPMDTPPVNGGDILNYLVTITSAATDETPNDNTFVLNQTVVNSFDPNDKTCLEGTTITPNQVGDYVHYLIRFENTGTHPARNIVIKDEIDAAKFDISSLVATRGSHAFHTKINQNQAEFIFENINLPFDDTVNDGFVAFKIKTKPMLELGDSFSNTASIYFDYNFPIVTNTTTTTVQTLKTQHFYVDDAFILYPNPANDVLQIVARENITITSIAIYNVMGQLILNIPNSQQSDMINVSELAAGNYLMKIHSSKGISRTKFIKQ